MATAQSFTISGVLNHLSDLDLYQKEKPYEIWIDKIDDGIPRTNVKFKAAFDVPVVDARTLHIAPTLETYGFEIFESPFPEGCNIKDADDVGKGPEQRRNMQSYIDGSTKALLKQFNGTKAVCYDWRVRKATHKPLTVEPSIYSLDIADDDDAREHKIDVAHQVHADSSPDGSKKMIAYLLSQEEKEDLAEGGYRLRLVNLWRPIVPVVENEPIAYCDIRTVRDDDWEPVEKIQEGWVEEAMYLKRQSSHRWYWFSDQTRDECVVFMIWDSLSPNKRSTSVAHCSVPTPATSHLPARQSIEMRFLLWTDAKTQYLS